MNDNKKSLLGNTAWNTAGTITYFACQWLTTVIVVWLYEDFANAGNLALAINISAVFYCIAAYNIRNFQVSDISNEYNDGDYIAARVITCAGALVLCGCFLAALGYPAVQLSAILCYMGVRTAEAFSDVLHGIFHKHGRLDYAGISMICRGVLMLIVFSIAGRISGLVPAVAVMAAISVIFILIYDVPNVKKYKDNVKINKNNIAKLLKRCFPLMVIILIFTFFSSYTRFMLERIYGPEALGAYATATTPAVAVQLSVTFLLAPLVSIFSKYFKETDRRRFTRVMLISYSITAGITLAAAVLAGIGGQWGLRLIFGDDIVPYAYLLQSAMVSAGLTASLLIMNTIYTTIRDIRFFFISCIAGVIICIAATGYFIRQYDLIGANLAMIACQGCVFLILIIRYPYTKKYFRKVTDR